MKKVILSISLSCVWVCTSWAQEIKHVILVSIDGFRPEFYQEEQWGTPNLKQMAKKGVSAKGVRTIFPSVTYPSHTTLSTGTLPHKHGVYYNTTVVKMVNQGNGFTTVKTLRSLQFGKKPKPKD